MILASGQEWSSRAKHETVYTHRTSRIGIIHCRHGRACLVHPRLKLTIIAKKTWKPKSSAGMTIIGTSNSSFVMSILNGLKQGLKF